MNAEGTEILSVENSLVSADYSVVGVGTRAIKTTYIDNLSVDIELDEASTNNRAGNKPTNR